MRLTLQGHDERYLIETLALLFFPAAGFSDALDDGLFALSQLEGETAFTRITAHGKSCEAEDRRQEGEAPSAALARSFYRAGAALTGITPPWGTLTGIRPAKLVKHLLDGGLTPEQAARQLERSCFTSKDKTLLCAQVLQGEQRALDLLDRQAVSIYLGIPFCPSRCSYCSFVSHDITSKRAKDILPVYVDRLCEELCCIAQKMAGTGLALTTVYFGGGTPTILSAGQLDQICTAVEKNFGLSRLKEYTVEAGRPDTIDREKLRTLRRHRVTRISINPQTLNDEVLAGIGRKHTAQQIIDCFEMAREEGFDDINMDLIAGLPGETVESFSRTVDRIIALNPENVTVHTLSIKRSANYGTSWEERLKALQLGEQVGQMVSYAQKALIQYGWQPYYLYKQRNTLGNLENTGYCKPGYEGRYNIYIMDETQTILAAGGGAVTKLKSNRTGKLERIFNYKYPFEYVEHFDEILKRKDKVVDFFEENRPLPLRED